MRPALLLAALLAGACAQVPPSPPAAAAKPSAVAAPVLADSGFEQAFDASRNCPPGWTCRVHADPTSFAFRSDATNPGSGSRSLVIQKTGNEPWATVSQSVPVTGLAGRTLRLTVSLRLEGVAGRGAGPWILARSHNDLKHVETLRTGTAGWQRVAVEVPVPADADSLEVGVILDAGGRAWFDAAQLDVLPAGSPR